jgi:D-sedoheptulose 7-phosphate isomerase
MTRDELDAKSMLIARRRVLDWLFNDAFEDVHRAAETLIECLLRGGSVFACGNGGSAAQAEHFEAELVGRFKRERKSLRVFALSPNSATLTAIANDYEFSELYSRQLEGIGRAGDCLLALSTSGNSKNVVSACMQAKRSGMKVLALTGREGGEIAPLADVTVPVPDTDTARIQEIHLIALHLICQIVEERLSSPDPSRRETV